MSLRIALLGGFHAEIGGHPVGDSTWQRTSAKTLIKLLALQPGHSLHREQLTDILWPELDPRAATGRLNKAVHFARRALAAGSIRLRDDVVTLDAEDLWIDVDAFDAAVRAGDVAAAIGLYAGDLLPENRFETWAETPRTRLRAAVVRLLLDHATNLEVAGEAGGATLSLERIVGFDPLHEEAHERLMRLSAAAGDRNAALRWYGRLVEALREELGVAPRESLRQLHADIAAGRPIPGAVAAAATPASAVSPPAVVSPPVEVPGIEERKLVTVVAVDLRGAPPDTDTTNPERSRRTTEAWTDLLCEILGRWSGTAERVVGGGVVAAFGFPHAYEDHAARALCAGFEILQRVPTPVRIGVDTGVVIVTGRGVALADIGGDVLDVAARLREAAHAGTLLAAERTRQAVQSGDFRFNPVLTADVSGQRSLIAHRLVAATRDAGWRVAEVEPPMVGREDEMEALIRLVDAAATSGSPRLATIVGVAGVGKSRLVREVVAAAVRRRPETTVLRGRCIATGDGVTYWALGEILRDACGIAFGEPSEAAQEKMRTRLGTLLSSSQLEDSAVAATIFALATTAAIRLRDNPLDAMTPREVAAHLAVAWPRFASACAANGPVLMVVEDLHWAGEPLLEMVARVAARTVGPLTLLTTARPEFDEGRPGFRFGTAEMSMISLRHLSDSSSRELLDSLPLGQGLAAHRREEIVARADGNPYFLEQLVAHVSAGAAAALPDTIHAVLAARVDALPSLEKRLLQAASVFGRAFWAEPIRRRLPGQDVDAGLVALENRGLVLLRQSSSLAGQAEYAFKHALLRDVAYASLATATRARAHADAGAWLEEISRDRAGEVIELIASHYAAALSEDADLAWVDDGKAREWIRGKAFRSLLDAGAWACRRSAIPRALDLHTTALGFATNASEGAEALEAIGDDHEVAFHGDDAVLAWQRALDLLRHEPGHGDHRARLCLKAALMAVARWGGFRVPADPAVGDRVIDEGLSIADNPAVRAQLFALRALCGGRWAWTGKPDPVPVAERHAAAMAARQLADELGAPAIQGLSLFGLAAVHFIEGSYDEAVTAAIEEADLMDRGGAARDRALGHVVAALLLSDVRGEYNQALVHARVAHTMSVTLSPHDRMHSTFILMNCLANLGRWAEVGPFLDEHLGLLLGPEAEMSCPYIRGGPLVAAIVMAQCGDVQRARETAARIQPDLEHPGYAEALHARLALELGDVETGRALAEGLMALGRRPGPEEVPPEPLVLVQALEQQGDWEALERFLPTARGMAGFMAVMTPTCDRAEALALAAAGANREAERLLDRAVAAFDRMSLPLPGARARERLAGVAPGRAGHLLVAALDVYERLGAVPDRTRARRPLTGI